MTRTPEQEEEHRLHQKELRRLKKQKGLCAWPGCQMKVGRRLMTGAPFTHCNYHRKYFREHQRHYAKEERHGNSKT